MKWSRMIGSESSGRRGARRERVANGIVADNQSMLECSEDLRHAWPDLGAKARQGAGGGGDDGGVAVGEHGSKLGHNHIRVLSYGPQRFGGAAARIGVRCPQAVHEARHRRRRRGAKPRERPCRLARDEKVAILQTRRQRRHDVRTLHIVFEHIPNGVETHGGTACLQPLDRFVRRGRLALRPSAGGVEKGIARFLQVAPPVPQRMGGVEAKVARPGCGRLLTHESEQRQGIAEHARRQVAVLVDRKVREIPGRVGGVPDGGVGREHSHAEKTGNRSVICS